jgi:ferritin
LFFGAAQCLKQKGGTPMANLTSKELTALEDQINYEQNLVKKYQAMANLCSDTKIQQDLNNFASKHRAHYNTLVSFLQ